MAAARSQANNARQPQNVLRQNEKPNGIAASSAFDPSEKITPADLELLRSNPSTETRSFFAAKFGHQYDAFSATSSKEFADTILYHLAKDAEAIVRRSLAETVAKSPNLPDALAMDLASDHIEIARPILEKSLVLEPPELINIVQSQTAHHAHAIAGRTTISESVSDALINTDYVDAIGRLLVNDGAEFSTDGLLRLARDFSENGNIQENLVKLANLPTAVVDCLIDGIGEALDWNLVKSRSIEPTEARQMVKALKGQTAKALAKREVANQATEAGLQKLMAKGALKPIDILSYLRDGNLGKFEGALAVMANLNAQQTKSHLYNIDKRAIAALCLRAGLGTPQYVAIRMALDLADMGTTEVRARRIKYPTKTARFIQEQYERLRNDKKLIGQFS